MSGRREREPRLGLRETEGEGRREGGGDGRRSLRDSEARPGA
jgi:hypothetical protein